MSGKVKSIGKNDELKKRMSGLLFQNAASANTPPTPAAPKAAVEAPVVYPEVKAPKAEKQQSPAVKERAEQSAPAPSTPFTVTIYASDEKKIEEIEAAARLVGGVRRRRVGASLAIRIALRACDPSRLTQEDIANALSDDGRRGKVE